MKNYDGDFEEEVLIRGNKLRVSQFYTSFNELLFKRVSNYNGISEDPSKLDIDRLSFVDILEVYFKALSSCKGDYDIFLKFMELNKSVYGLSDDLYNLFINTARAMLDTGVKMEEVESSNVRSIGYDDVLNELYVEFHNGGKYKYFDVTKEDFNKLKNSPSVGSFLNSNIKKSKDYQRMK